ncbi:MAG TPA: GNAT family N-acetyltransferase [Lachnospiraceae bacterium]|nr:GNAT family N-acetyltransferase [Lachnospiraceae bacterium]
MIWKYSEGKIYSEDENGGFMSEAEFTISENGVVNIYHVYVEPQFRGNGLAHKTMLEVVEYLKNEKRKATATCPYADAWFKKNPLLCSEIIF